MPLRMTSEYIFSHVKCTNPPRCDQPVKPYFAFSRSCCKALLFLGNAVADQCSLPLAERNVPSSEDICDIFHVLRQRDVSSTNVRPLRKAA